MLLFILDVTVSLLATFLTGFSMAFLPLVIFQSRIDSLWNMTFRSTLLGAAAVGTLIWLWLFRNKSRVFSMQLGCLLSFAGSSCSWASSCNLMAYWPNIILFLIGLVLNGLANPFLYCAATVRLFENAPTAWKGMFSCLPWLGLTGAITVTQTGIVHCSWELSACFGAALAFLVHMLLWHIPEPDKQPQNASSDQLDAQSLLESDHCPSGTNLNADKTSSRPVTEYQPTVRFNMCCITDPRKRTLVWLILLHQLTGPQALMTVAELFFNFAPQQWTVGYAVAVGLPQLVGTSLAVLASDRVPSLYLLRFSSLVLAIAQFAVGYLLKFQSMILFNSSLIGCIALGLGAHGIGWGPIPLFLINSIYSDSERGWVVGMAMLISAVCQLITEMLFEPLLTVVGLGNYFCLSALLCLCAVSVIQVTQEKHAYLSNMRRQLSFKLNFSRLGRTLHVDSGTEANGLFRQHSLLGPRFKTV